MNEPVLELDDIQGHVVVGFNSNHQCLVFLRFGSDISKTRALFQILSKRVTTARSAYLFRRARRVLLAQLQSEPPIDLVGVAVALTYPGLAQMAPDASRIRPCAFVAGAAARAGLLGDPSESSDAGFVGNWLYGNEERPVDALVVVASDDQRSIERELGLLFGELPVTGGVLERFGASVVAIEHGADLPGDLAGHEHFGFKDGISQPGLRGRVNEKPDSFFTRRDIAATSGEIAQIQGIPGQDLIWPGEFILGESYPEQDDRYAALSLPGQAPALPWMQNGSFLVYRRLRQNVDGFRKFVARVSTSLGDEPDLPKVSAALVGRWPSGAPILRAPILDDQALAGDRSQNNAFTYLAAYPSVTVNADSGAVMVAGAPSDSVGAVCPHFAHIRKVNPRDVSTEAGNARAHRILRRGIPYGPPFEEPDNVDRGLLFLCYQALIEDGFETIQANWANRTDQPQAGGHDVIIGQPGGGALQTISLHKADGTMVTATLADRLVRPTAAAYLFAPSRSALKAFAEGMRP